MAVTAKYSGTARQVAHDQVYECGFLREYHKLDLYATFTS